MSLHDWHHNDKTGVILYLHDTNRNSKKKEANVDFQHLSIYHTDQMEFIYMLAVNGEFLFIFKQKELEDTKGIIRIRILKKNRQDNGQKKKYKQRSTKHDK